ncbi:MAG: FAD-binding protein, partial [Planctomycetes bacterium]|nr:FAD-binding protein [Planctomycetota bacterium]
ILEIYEKFVGVDPLDVPMKIFPGMHYSMGGLWVDFEKDETSGGINWDSPRNQHTNIPGLFAIGEADYRYHGANRLGANSLLSCIFAGLVNAQGIRTWLGNLPHGSVDKVAATVFDAEVARHKAEYDALIARDGDENPYLIHRELGEIMTRNCTVVRKNPELETALNQVVDLTERCRNAALSDRSTWTNQNLSFTRALGDMLLLARVIVKGALLRNECRGAHYKPEFAIAAPSADDADTLKAEATEWCKKYQKQNEEWLKTTLAKHTDDGPEISYEPVDTSLTPPRPRTYGLKGAEIIDQVWKETIIGGTKPSRKKAAAAADK